MSLTGAAVAYSYDVLVTVDVLAPGQLQYQRLVERGDGQEVEGIQTLGGGKAGCLDPAVHHAVMSVDQLKLRQAQQIVWMVDSLGGAPTRHLVVLPEEGGELELLQMVLKQHRRLVAHDRLAAKRVM